MNAAPFSPAVGDAVIAIDAYGNEHRVTVTEAPRRGHSMAVIGLRFDDLPAHQHTTLMWPLSAVRPVPTCYPGMGCDQSDCDTNPRCSTGHEGPQRDCPVHGEAT